LSAQLRMTCTALLLLASASAVHAEPQLEVMPALGLGKATGEDSDAIDLGPGLLVSVGARLHPMASLRGQLSVDRPGIDAEDSGLDVSLWILRAQLVPALHVGNEKVDLGFGPTLGLFYMRASAEGRTRLGNIEARVTVRGFTLGGQAWLMVKVPPDLSLGPVFSYGRLWATRTCTGEPGTPENCDENPENQDQGYLNLSLGVLF